MKFEENLTATFQQAALEEVQTEHAPYFEALKQHPRMLAGTQVPAIGREGMETLRDAADAREWQDAVKQLLADEVRDRASRALESSATPLNTVHAAIELFQSNADLVPGTKGFDIELANRFSALATPYEVRVEGALHGYSVPVQPIIDHLRTSLASERAARVPVPQQPAAAATTAAPAAGGAPTPPAATPDPPQVGIAAKAGAGAPAGEDFSTLFGTIGLPSLQI